jgi:amidase
VPVQPVMKEVVRNAARALQQIGMNVEAFEPRGLERAPNLWWMLFGRLSAPSTRKLIEGHESETHWTLTESLNQGLAEPLPAAEEIVTTLALRDSMRAHLLRQMEQVPLLLLPACGIPAFRHRERRWQAGDKEIGLFQAMMTVTPFNLLGLPAAVVPFGFTDQGLPVGVQLVGLPYSEELILEIAVRMEEVRGPFPGPSEFAG